MQDPDGPKQRGPIQHAVANDLDEGLAEVSLCRWDDEVVNLDRHETRNDENEEETERFGVEEISHLGAVGYE